MTSLIDQNELKVYKAICESLGRLDLYTDLCHVETQEELDEVLALIERKNTEHQLKFLKPTTPY